MYSSSLLEVTSPGDVLVAAPKMPTARFTVVRLPIVVFITMPSCPSWFVSAHTNGTITVRDWNPQMWCIWNQLIASSWNVTLIPIAGIGSWVRYSRSQSIPLRVLFYYITLTKPSNQSAWLGVGFGLCVHENVYMTDAQRKNTIVWQSYGRFYDLVN